MGLGLEWCAGVDRSTSSSVKCPRGGPSPESRRQRGRRRGGFKPGQGLVVKSPLILQASLRRLKLIPEALYEQGPGHTANYSLNLCRDLCASASPRLTGMSGGLFTCSSAGSRLACVEIRARRNKRPQTGCCRHRMSARQRFLRLYGKIWRWTRWRSLEHSCICATVLITRSLSVAEA